VKTKKLTQNEIQPLLWITSISLTTK